MTAFHIMGVEFVTQGATVITKWRVRDGCIEERCVSKEATLVWTDAKTLVQTLGADVDVPSFRVWIGAFVV